MPLSKMTAASLEDIGYIVDGSMVSHYAPDLVVPPYVHTRGGKGCSLM